MTPRAFAIVLSLVLLLPGVVQADARVVNSRTAPGEERPQVIRQPGRWRLNLGVGMAAGGDLFQVIGEQTVSWSNGLGGTFQAERYDVTLDEDVLAQVGLEYALSRRASLRLLFQWTDMDLTALADDSQFVTPVLWDRAQILRLGVVWEQRLTETRLQPYLLAGALTTHIDATAEALDQSGLLTPVVGAGAVWLLNQKLALRMEFTDGIRQLDSEGLLGGLLPQGTDLRERGPQHLVGLTAGLRMSF